ncbi:hypothetical protein B9J96_06870 [Enterobacter roggenkampii]|nr:hypothetical protein B9J96_06870 [Enterobacter roggenkampii]
MNIALNEPENSLPPQMLPALASLIAETRLYSQICLTSFDGGGGDAGGEAGVVSMGTEAVFSHLASVKHANKEPQIPGPA